MAYTQVADPLLNSGKPIRSADIKQMRDNQDNFDGRITALEDPSIRVASHFSSVIGGAQDIVTGAASYDDHPDFWFKGAANSVIRNGIWDTNGGDFHRIEFVPSAAAGDCLLVAKTGFYFDNRTKPLVCTIRFKVNDSASATGWSNYHVGLASDNDGYPPVSGQPDNGIYLIRDSNTDWLIRARRDNTDTDDAAWTHGSDDAWVELIITWVSASSAVSVTVDGTERGTFTVADNIPDDRVVYPFVAAWNNNDNADYFYIDRVECYASGAITDLA